MVINTNNAAISSARNLNESSGMLNKSLARLSSGSRLVSPADDAAGYAISTRFDAQINRSQAASDNVGNAISFTQTQDGYLKKVAKALDRMSELSIMALDVTKSDADRALYNSLALSYRRRAIRTAHAVAAAGPEHRPSAFERCAALSSSDRPQLARLAEAERLERGGRRRFYRRG